MKILIGIAMLFVATVSAVAQATCTLQSCRSFHELLSHKDADITNAIKGGDQQVFVCFRSKDDSFFIVSNLIIPNHWWAEDQRTETTSQPPTSQPQSRNENVDYDALAKQAGAVDPSEIKTSKTFDSEKQSGPFHSAGGGISLQTYKNGQSDELFFTTSRWSAWGHRENGKFVMEGSPAFSAKCSLGPDCTIDADNASLTFSRTFTNQNDGTTEHTIRLRFSTARFSENLSWDTTAKEIEGRTTANGRCEEYSNGKRIR